MCFDCILHGPRCRRIVSPLEQPVCTVTALPNARHALTAAASGRWVVQAVRESGMKVEAQLEPSVLTSAAGEDSMSSGSVDMTSSSGDSSSDEGPPLPPPATFEVPSLHCSMPECQ